MTLNKALNRKNKPRKILMRKHLDLSHQIWPNQIRFSSFSPTKIMSPFSFLFLGAKKDERFVDSTKYKKVFLNTWFVTTSDICKKFRLTEIPANQVRQLLDRDQKPPSMFIEIWLNPKPKSKKTKVLDERRSLRLNVFIF